MKALLIVLLISALSCVISVAQTESKSSSAAAAKVPDAPHQHPKVAPRQECSDCHRQQVAQWETSPHAGAQVKCLVCHGSVEENFMSKPPISRCDTCHSQLVAQLRSDSFMKGKTCFNCHPPHTLKPHQAAPRVDIQE